MFVVFTNNLVLPYNHTSDHKQSADHPGVTTASTGYCFPDNAEHVHRNIFPHAQ